MPLGRLILLTFHVRRTQRLCDLGFPVPLMCFVDGVPFLRCLGFTFQRLVFLLLSCFQEFKVTDKELLTRPTASLGKTQASAMPLSIENLEESDEDPCDVGENFSTKQLFSFAWQIAKGMVIILFSG